MELQRSVGAAIGRVRPRPGLMVVGATDGAETAVASAGLVPGPAGSPERAMFEIGSVTKVFTSLLLAIAADRLNARDPSDR